MKIVTLTDPVDREIYECLNPINPKAFFLFAGAGSGKTRSLVNVLKSFRDAHAQRLRLAGQKVAVITYTNAACDEINSRLEYDATFAVSTIHSFSWELIKPFRRDMKDWLELRLKSEIADLEEKQSKGKANTKAAIDRPRQIASKMRRLETLRSVERFVYSPDGDNTEWNALNHAEVIAMTGDFLLHRNLLSEILIRKYPILLIDESQDTKAELLDAFFQVHKEHSNEFTLGLFGDRMQRIYQDGKKNLGDNLPGDWKTPAKTINYRCPKRVITLINKIREPLGDPPQTVGKSDGEEGFVRLFLAKTLSSIDKSKFEESAQKEMASITGDEKWIDENEGPKILTLEHLMAARRGGFESFFRPLYAVDRFKTGLLTGKLSAASLFANQVLPLIDAVKANNKFEVARLVRKYSPILKSKTLQQSKDAIVEIKRANKAVQSLADLWSNAEPRLIDVLKEIHQSGIFVIPEMLSPIAQRGVGDDFDTSALSEENDDDDNRDKKIDAWDEALECSFGDFREYVRYVSNASRFGTHQGIKGREFPRVMVVLDDEEAGGFLFKYDRLLGAEDLSPTDIKNQREGLESTVDRTRRLFYVTCSRAEKSLAVIAYTVDPAKAKSRVIEMGWFNDDEVVAEF